MKASGTGSFKVLKALWCALILGSCESAWMSSGFTAGPKSNEKGIYIYKRSPSAGLQYCKYCPEGAFENTRENVLYQEYECIIKYNNISKEIKPTELKEHKIPICKEGEIPGCGPPPDEKMSDDYEWSCDQGFGKVNFSVYSSCALIYKKSRAVAWSYYCNENLTWEHDSSISPLRGNMQKTLLIVVLGFGTIVIGCVVVFVVWMCLKKRRIRNESSDVEARQTFISVDGKSSSPCSTGNKKSIDQESLDSGISDGVGERDKNVRQPPYGEERPPHIESQIDEEKTRHNSQNSLENPSTEMSARSNPCSDHSSQLISQSHTLLDNSDDSQMLLSNERNTHAEIDTVRAELQPSLVSNGRICQCLLYNKPSNSLLKDNKSSLEAKTLLQMKPLNNPYVSKDMNILTKKSKEGQVEGMSLHERPNPQGNISMSTYTESGYFDDENDKRHNTNPKEVARSGTGKEDHECACCAENSKDSPSGETGATQCVYRSNQDSTVSIMHLSNNSEENNQSSESRKDSDEEKNDSFEIKFEP